MRGSRIGREWTWCLLISRSLRLSAYIVRCQASRAIGTIRDMASALTPLEARDAVASGPGRRWLLLSATLLIFSALATISISEFLMHLPSWSEEKGWLRIAREISLGRRTDPIAAKSDYPSSFQAFPIGFLMYLGWSPLEASRYTAVLYALVSSTIFAALGWLFSGRRIIGAIAGMIFSFITFTTFYYACTGWHEVTHVNLLTGASIYLLMACIIRERAEPHTTLALGVILALGLWTLYTPAVTSLIVVGVIILVPQRWFSLRAKLLTAVSFVLMNLPLIFGLLRGKGSSFGRHRMWLTRGSEHGPHVNHWDLVDRVTTTLQHIGYMLRPQGSLPNWYAGHGIFPEWPLTISALVGVTLCFWRRKLILGLILPCLATFIVVGTSNPTSWRASIFATWILIFATVGFALIFAKKKGKLWTTGAVVILGLQVYYCITPFRIFITAVRNEMPWTPGVIGLEIARACPSIHSNRPIVARHDYSLELLDLSLSAEPTFILLPPNTPLESVLQRRNDWFLLLTPVGSKPDELPPESFTVACSRNVAQYQIRLYKRLLQPTTSP